jgi:hypothetical protein
MMPRNRKASLLDHLLHHTAERIREWKVWLMDQPLKMREAQAANRQHDSTPEEDQGDDRRRDPSPASAFHNRKAKALTLCWMNAATVRLGKNAAAIII